MEGLSKLIEPARTALVVIDVQNDYCHPRGEMGLSGADMSSIDPAVDNIERLIDAARRLGVAVVFVRNWHEKFTDSEPWLTKKASTMRCANARSWGAEFYRIAPMEDEPIVSKYRYSGFVGTTLDQALKTFKRETLIITGVSTNICVESTARHAVFLDYRIVFTSDGTATSDGDAIQKASLHNMSNYFGRVASTDEILAAWQSPAAPVPRAVAATA